METLPASWYVAVGVRRSKGSYEYPKITIPIEALRRAGIRPGDVLRVVEASGVLVISREEEAPDVREVLASLLEAYGYSVDRGENIVACRGDECILVARFRRPAGRETRPQ